MDNLLLKGFLSFLKKEEDENLTECKKKYGIFFIFHSIEKWKKETGGKQENIPIQKLILCKFLENRFIAPP